MSRNNKKHRADKKNREAKQPKAAAARRRTPKHNDGKELERLVRTIEQAFFGTSFTITPNVRAGQAAEFDLVVEGKLGSSSIKWDIECRDRPSDGPAPGAWIEQLVGRRSRFNFDKVIAVSTTGFAKDAIEYARDENIVLRTVKQIAEISKVVELKEIRLSGTTIKWLCEPTLTYRRDDLLAIPASKRPHGTLYVRERDQASKRPLEDLFLFQIRSSPEYKEADDITLINDTPVMISSDGSDELLVYSMSIDFRVIIKHTPFKALTVKEYAEDSTLLGRHVEYGSTVEGIPRIVRAYEVFDGGVWKMVEGMSNILADKGSPEMRSFILKPGEIVE